MIGAIITLVFSISIKSFLHNNLDIYFSYTGLGIAVAIMTLLSVPLM